MNVTVAVATFGDPAWEQLARSRALPTVPSDVPSVHVHAATLHDARNECLDLVDTEWIIYLDADDELEAGYIDAMAQATGDLRVPAVRYVKNNSYPQARFPRVVGHQHYPCVADCLEWGNWLVIGTAVRAQLVRDVGGWRDFQWSEDWDLWVRCWRTGATVEPVPAAIYRAHIRRDSRNRGPDHAIKHSTHQAIARANGLPVPS